MTEETCLSGIQLHFIINTLLSIRELLFTDPSAAGDLLEDFVFFLHSVFSASITRCTHPFSQEIKIIKAYVRLEQMRFGNRFIPHYDLRSVNFPVIVLGIQPLVENAIRHGLLGSCAGGCVWIRSYETADFYCVDVEDEGIGFDHISAAEKHKEDPRESYALFNVATRFKTMLKANITIESKHMKGTKITIKIPKRVCPKL